MLREGAKYKFHSLWSDLTTARTHGIQPLDTSTDAAYMEFGLVWFTVFKATFNNILVLFRWSVLLVEETGENH